MVECEKINLAEILKALNNTNYGESPAAMLIKRADGYLRRKVNYEINLLIKIINMDLSSWMFDIFDILK